MKERVEDSLIKGSLHKMAVITDKTRTDKKALRAFQRRYKIVKNEAQILKLLELASKVNKFSIIDEFGYGKFTVEDRVEQFITAARDIEERQSRNGRQKKFDAQKAKERRAYKIAQAYAQNAEERDAEETWGQEEGEYLTMADREEAEAIALEKHDREWQKWIAGVKAEQARKEKANQTRKDGEYLRWYKQQEEMARFEQDVKDMDYLLWYEYEAEQDQRENDAAALAFYEATCGGAGK